MSRLWPECTGLMLPPLGEREGLCCHVRTDALHRSVFVVVSACYICLCATIGEINYMAKTTSYIEHNLKNRITSERFLHEITSSIPHVMGA